MKKKILLFVSVSIVINLLEAARHNDFKNLPLEKRSIVLKGIKEPVIFTLTHDPIDVVIPTIEKDLETLELCIENIKKYGKNVRNIYVVSPRKLTSKAIWIDERIYPFSMKEVARNLFGNDDVLDTYLKQGTQRIGWYFQQLLKLYAPVVIPNISSNVLVLDSDTIFINPVSFMNELNEPFFCQGRLEEYHEGYFVQANSLIPGLNRVFPKISGIAHHMIFQKDIIINFFNTIEKIHKKPAWQAICHCVPKKDRIIEDYGLSEFELYVNFVLAVSRQGHLRPLKWLEIKFHDKLGDYAKAGYHFISCHSFMRDMDGYLKGSADLE